MSTETQQVVQNSSTAVAANPATSNTRGRYRRPVEASAGAIPTPTPVVALQTDSVRSCSTFIAGLADGGPERLGDSVEQRQ